MEWIDYTIIVIIAISAVIGLVRGFMREAISITFWVIGFWVAFTFADPLAQHLQHVIPKQSIRTGVCFLVLFLLIILIGAVISFLLMKLVDKTGLTGTNRILGFIFGVLRGVLVVALLLLLAGATTMPDSQWWLNSTLIPHFAPLVEYLQDLLPMSVAAYFVPSQVSQQLATALH